VSAVAECLCWTATGAAEEEAVIIIQWIAPSVSSSKGCCHLGGYTRTRALSPFSTRVRVTRGHTLVVPRRHAEDIWALSEDEVQAVMRSVHRVACLLREKLNLLGLNVTQANGRAAWQDVFHYHVHLIPRYGDDRFSPPWCSTSPSEKQLNEIRHQILKEQPPTREP